MAKKINLGYKSPHDIYPSMPEGAKGKKKQAPTIYPSFSIEQKPELIKHMPVGSEHTLQNVKVKVTGVRHNQPGKYDDPNGDPRSCIDCDMTGFDHPGIPDNEDSAPEESAEQAMTQYMAEKKAGKK